MNRRKLILAIAISFGCCAAQAAGGGGGGGPTAAGSASKDPVLQTARAAIDKQDWAAAQSVLEGALAVKPQNADYHVLYAFAVRKSDRPNMELVFSHYAEALRIDPGHQGAHEYIGEAYLMVGNEAKAREHLAALDKLCFFGCEEYTDLKKAIASYAADHPR